MLYSLHVKNLALIEEQEIRFTPGLNILTGETGTGKSVLIGSINLALGDKADRTLIRDGADQALIELVFDGRDERLRALLRSFDLPDDEETLTLTRKIYPDRSICRVQGETVPLKQLKLLAEHLISIHGQHEHQVLLDEKRHLKILDDYAGKALAEEKEKLSTVFASLSSVRRQRKETDLDERERKREADLCAYEIAEIDDAALEEGEDERLDTEYRRLLHAGRITEALTKARAYLASENEDNATGYVSQAARALSGVLSYDETLSSLAEEVDQLEGLLSDAVHGMDAYLKESVFDEVRFRETEERLNLLNRLKEKYGGDLSRILRYRDEQEERLRVLNDLDQAREALEREEKRLTTEALALAGTMHEMREISARALETEMIRVLRELAFPEIRFQVEVSSSEEALTAEGYDHARFLISVNPGESVKPLSRVASGGELSRIMLALKSIRAGADEIDAMIFDEIDAGISGKTAWKVAEQLSALAANGQVVCITHLPQIAAMADTHVRITKESVQGRTRTELKTLTEEETVHELARLLGSEQVTETVLMNARELRAQAGASKQKGKR